MDPMRSISMRLWITRSLTAMFAATLGAWLLLPLGPIDVDLPELEPEPGRPGGGDGRDDWDESAFAAVIWNVPPRVEPQEPEQATPEAKRAPLKLQLLAIVTTDDGTRMAALYDPNEDALHIVANGENIGEFTIESIEPPQVTLVRGRDRRVMSLRREDG